MEPGDGSHGLPESYALFHDVACGNAPQHGGRGMDVLTIDPLREAFRHRAVSFNRGLEKPSLRSPACTSGTAMKSFHRRPVRWFSIMTMIGP